MNRFESEAVPQKTFPFFTKAPARPEAWAGEVLVGGGAAVVGGGAAVVGGGAAAPGWH